jgi:uncharacterized repeat protein (TIGR01451 family)
MRQAAIVVWITLALPSLANAQFMPAPPPPSPPPLVYVKFTGPEGAKLTLYRRIDAGQTFDLPCTIGFRPGYSYRLALGNVEGFKGRVFAPTLEVRGTLLLGPRLANRDYPARIHFSVDELERAASGNFIKKVITLERPDLAIPVATKRDEPLEINVPAPTNPYVVAAEKGDPIIVYHLGGRVVTVEEMNALAIPGTVLLPGEKVLGMPPVAPYLSWNWCPVYDPVHGPRHPSEFVTVWDGGDSRNPAGFNRDNKLKGVDPTDTMAEYVDSKGNKKLAISNRVGICVPRFITFKGEYGLASQASRLTLDTAHLLKTAASNQSQVSLKEQWQQQHSEGVGTRLRMSSTYQSWATSVVGRVQGLQIKSQLQTTDSVTATQAGPAPAEAPEGPLRIIKWPDKSCANVGDIVTFYLKYSNTGGQPITNVVVTDSLSPRLEYVKGSTKTDRDAMFTMQPNEAGSSMLRWEFTSPLQPREHGLISFEVRVR